MHSHLLFSYFRSIFAKLYLQINKKKFWINLKNISKTAKVQISCADQNSNCILGKMLQIIYLIKFGRDKVHTVFSMIFIANVFRKTKNKNKTTNNSNNCMNTKIKIFDYYIDYNQIHWSKLYTSFMSTFFSTEQ